MNIDWTSIWNSLTQWALNTGVRILIALILFFVSFRVINLVGRRIERRATKRFDKTLTKVLCYAFRTTLKICVVIGLVAYLGIDTSGLTALVAALGVTIGLAVNGALSNIAGGVLIVVTRPFRIDDFIEVAGQSGTVEDIRLCFTKIVTIDNRVVYIPNATAATGVIVNFSEKDKRRIDLDFPMAPDADIEKAREILLSVSARDERVLTDPVPFARITRRGENGPILTLRAWVNSGDYWPTNFDLQEEIKRAFDEAGIRIPYNQLDVHLHQ